MPYSRRDFLKTAILLPASAFLAACARALSLETMDSPTGIQPAASPLITVSLEPTPACGDNDDPTPEQTEGPFYTPSSPERKSLLETDTHGVYMLVSGQVLGTDCQPVAGALLDFWHADADGNYDNVGFKLRGHQFADEQGRYELETIMPGLYPGRTRHFHVKVQHPNGPVLTTQLYFPDETDNATDGIFDERLLLTMLPADNGIHGQFDFVLSA
jgi:protocatechuate 3,4-dioxygenase beta subunit